MPGEMTPIVMAAVVRNKNLNFSRNLNRRQVDPKCRRNGLGSDPPDPSLMFSSQLLLTICASDDPRGGPLPV
jgi:hypothetical protein